MSEINKDTKISDIAEECAYRHGNCEATFPCIHKDVCKKLKNEMPFAWMKPDPPRFTEAQMALWRAWYGVGAKQVSCSDKDCMYLVQGAPDILTRQFGKITMIVGAGLGLSMEKPLDLAELLGKDGAK